MWNGRFREEQTRSGATRGAGENRGSVAGGKGFWEGGLEQGVWVQGREEQQWFQKVGALVWKEPVEWRGKKTQKLSKVERRCGGHFIARRLVHGDDESVKQYNKEADEIQEGETRAVVLQKMQNAGQIARTGEE
jgi:hypothetical protein